MNRRVNVCLFVLSFAATTATGQAGPEACPSQDSKLLAWVEAKRSDPQELLPVSQTYVEFILELRQQLMKNKLPHRAIEILFSADSAVHPSCAGHWLEFGVWSGQTINLAASWKAANCQPICQDVFGFDTFTGLPEAWKRDAVSGASWGKGHFDLQGQMPTVKDNVFLWPGLFSESLPAYLQLAHSLGRDQPAAFIHIDCDLYAGTRDALELLTDHIVPGTVLVFDDLINYGAYHLGELRGLWEWLQATGIQLAVLGVKGPLPNSETVVKLVLEGQEDHFHQSVSFVVISKPQAAKPWVPLSETLLEDVPSLLRKTAQHKSDEAAVAITSQRQPGSQTVLAQSHPEAGRRMAGLNAHLARQRKGHSLHLK